MAVAYASPGYGANSPDVTGVTFSYNNAGNALCLVVRAGFFNAGSAATITATYAGQSLTADFSQTNTDYNSYKWTGLHKLNAASGPNTLVVSADAIQDDIFAYVISVSGASTTTLTGFNSIAATAISDDATHTTPALAISSQATDLVIGFADFNGSDGNTQSLNGGTVLTTPAGTPLTPFFSNSYAGASPSVSFTQTYYGSTVDVANGYFLAGFSFAPSGAGPVSHSYLGYSGVVNQIQTTPGNATGVVGNANNGSGDDVAGSGVVDVYTGVP